MAFVDRLLEKDGRLSAQLDNVLTAACLVHLFALGFKGTAFFTAQEEAGSSWRFLLEWFRRFDRATDRLVVVDTSPFADEESADRQQVVLRTRDANASFSEVTTARVQTACEAVGVSYLYKDRFIEEKNAEAFELGQEPSSLGSTEMGRIIAASQGSVGGTTLQIPTTGYHTMQETASLDSLEAFMSVLLHLAAH